MIHIRKMEVTTIAAALLLACSGQVLAQKAAATAPSVTYTASGKFASSPVSGTDTFRLAGEPFTISIVASEATKPHSNGKGWATYTGLTAKGTVTSALVPQSPFTLGSTHTFMALALGNPQHDVVELIVPVVVVKQQIRISAKLQLPHGTFTKWTIAPFNSTAKLDPSTATVTYSDGSNTTTLAIASGTLSATVK
jgi:hypothetical protein